MHTVATKTQYLQITGVAILAGLIISIIKVYNDSLINDDAVIYLTLADTMLAGDWQYAFSKFPLPFYSILIHGVAAISGLDTIAAAHTLNALLSSALIFAFLYTFYHLGASARLLIITAVLVVFFPSFIKYKSMIIREHGYLAGMVFAMGNVFLYSKYKHTRYLVIAVTILALAALFRFEAVVYIGALPLIAYIAYKGKDVSLHKLALLAAVLCVVGLMALYLWAPSASSEASMLGRLFSLFKDKYMVFQGKADVLADSVLSKYNRGSAGIFTIFGFLAVLLASILHRISVVYLVMVVYGYLRPSVFKQGSIHVIWLLFAGISFMTLIGLLLNHYIIIGRYSLAMAIMCIFPAAYGLHSYLYNRPETGNKTRIAVYVFVGLFLFVNTVQKLTADDRSAHISEAAVWIKNNISPDAIILSNSGPLLYQAGHSHFARNSTGLFGEIGHVKQPQYRALVEAETGEKSASIIKQFRGHKSVVNIYKVAE